MRKLLAAGMLMALSVGQAMAADQVPSDASLHELLDVMHAHSLLDSVLARADETIHARVQAGMQGKTLDPSQQKIMAEGEHRMADLMKRELTWEKMEPVYLEIYRKSFSQKEVNDMIGFYKTPSGQSVMAKMPAAMQETSQIVTAKIKVMMPEMMKIAQETGNQLNAYNATKGGAAPADLGVTHE